mmetsp:Transcript_55451/g.132509  ORF Transcript_55451/g.132509 Transcript_55451/m.132509 type:complete len:186 (-) Transcript_55451:254-811(-)|eukprot:CAMPEP_0181438360 /NCGR_PEP_ID=MMETSP1110-20121109/21869_1 /TAXON_ID=174948 /ORGANISM="Symbiodinium sp., Strain CCMP421" /LENGTH=185 /DNA_ID=CAMNT_0023562045 /DNA_START=68 /DNA_END=625 /DNA_ORIENTATION=-
MTANRASCSLAIPPRTYGCPKGKFWSGVGELQRYPTLWEDTEGVFEEYLNGPSLSPSRHQKSLGTSRGLMELHYDSMRKKAQERAKFQTQTETPSMGRAYAACSGYSGLIPGKLSGNVVGCTFSEGSKLANETHGHKFPRPMSGVTFTLGFRNNSSRLRTNSLPNLQDDSSRSTLSQAGWGALKC